VVTGGLLRENVRVGSVQELANRDSIMEPIPEVSRQPGNYHTRARIRTGSEALPYPTDYDSSLREDCHGLPTP
jgi:hypothetical protein